VVGVDERVNRAEYLCRERSGPYNDPEKHRSQPDQNSGQMVMRSKVQGDRMAWGIDEESSQGSKKGKSDRYNDDDTTFKAA
jgi:hypothetical protein